MDGPDPLSAWLAAVFLFGVPVYLAVGVPLCFWRARRRARQGQFTPRWAWGVSSAFVAGPALLLGVLVSCDLATDPASTSLTLLLCGIPLVPVLIAVMRWWLTTVSGWRWPLQGPIQNTAEDRARTCAGGSAPASYVCVSGSGETDGVDTCTSGPGPTP